MASTKAITGLVMTIVAIAICAGLIYYLMAVPGHVAAMAGLPDDATSGISVQLGPTIVGVGAIGLLVAFGFVLKVVGATSRRSAKAIVIDEGEPFDADAALARYLERKANGDTPDLPEHSPAPTAPVAFGRKSV